MKILRRQQQAAAIGCSRWTVNRIAKTDPTYPPEIEISPGISGVIESDFEAWLRSRPLRVRLKEAQPRAPSSQATHPLPDAVPAPTPERRAR